MAVITQQPTQVFSATTDNIATGNTNSNLSNITPIQPDAISAAVNPNASSMSCPECCLCLSELGQCTVVCCKIVGDICQALLG